MSKIEGEHFIIHSDKQAKMQSSGKGTETNILTPSIIRDKETGVEYIVITSVYGVAITPRIKPEKVKLSVEKLQ